MSTLEWDGSLAIGHEKIDAQHRSLVDLINKLHNSQGNRSGKKEMLIIMMELYKYALFHFNEEEAVMGALDPALRDSHKLEHQKFIEQLDVFAVKLREGEADIGAETFNWLVGWLLDHVSGTDKRLVEALPKAFSPR